MEAAYHNGATEQSHKRRVKAAERDDYRAHMHSPSEQTSKRPMHVVTAKRDICRAHLHTCLQVGIPTCFRMHLFVQGCAQARRTAPRRVISGEHDACSGPCMRAREKTSKRENNWRLMAPKRDDCHARRRAPDLGARLDVALMFSNMRPVLTIHCQ